MEQLSFQFPGGFVWTGTLDLHVPSFFFVFFFMNNTVSCCHDCVSNQALINKKPMTSNTLAIFLPRNSRGSQFFILRYISIVQNSQWNQIPSWEVIPESSVPAADPSELQKGKKKPTPSLIIGTVKNSQAFIQVTDYVISTGCKTLRRRGSTALRGELWSRSGMEAAWKGNENGVVLYVWLNCLLADGKATLL